MISALYVQTGGVYYGLPDVDPWDEERDARLYPGPHPVVAHPPCARWCRLAGLVEARYGYRRGEDGGCFAAALASVRRWGGVLEHPAYSDAWPAHGLPVPSRRGYWERDFFSGEWVCEVDQWHYGHRARKRTWLLAVLPEGLSPPPLLTGAVPQTAGADQCACGCSNSRRALSSRAWQSWCKKHDRDKVVERLTRAERAATPLEFRDLLLSIARMAGP